MASPQKEDGHTDIANEILEALWKINLSAYETRVLMFLLRKTYGWHKKIDAISLSQFEKAIGLDRRLIHRTLKELSSKGMIVVIPQDDRRPVSYGFQKDYQKWKPSSTKITHHKRIIPRDDKTIIPRDDALSSQGIPTKETNTKETIKENYTQDFLLFYNLYPNRKEKRETFKKWKKLNKKLPPIEVILEAIKKQIKWRENAGGEFRPEWKHPATWLNKGCWEDEVEINTGPPTDPMDRRMWEIEQLRKKNAST